MQQTTDIESRNRLSARARKWVAGIIAIMVGLATWGGVRAYHSWQAVKSAENVRELSAGLFRYANAHGGRYPDDLSQLMLNEPDIDPRLFVTPWSSDTPPNGSTPEERAAQLLAGGHCSYVYVGAGRTRDDVDETTVLLFEADVPNPIGSIYCLFGDGHGESLSVPDAITAIVRSVKKPVATTPATNPASQPAGGHS